MTRKTLTVKQRQFIACASAIFICASGFIGKLQLVEIRAAARQGAADESDSPVPAQTGPSARTAQVQGAETSAKDPLGFFERPARTRLARLDPVTLDAAGPQVPIGEYHWAAAASPDGLRLAVATGGPGGGIQIIDLQRMERVHSIHTGIAAEALGWLTPNRLVAALQCNPTNYRGRGCGIVLVDADNGRVVRRWPETERDAEFLPFRPPMSPPKPVAVTRHGILFLLGNWREIAAARLVLITKDEELRSVSLPPIRIGLHPTSWFGELPMGVDSSAGLAVDSAGERAFVVGAESTVAEINLSTMDVRYHNVSGLDRKNDIGERRAIWLPGGSIAVFGDDFVIRSGGSTRVPAGVRIIDTNTWRARTIDGRASWASFASGSLLVYGGELRGLTGCDPAGRERFRVFQDEHLRDVFVDGADAYVVTMETADRGGNRVRVIDAGTGSLRREGAPLARLVDLIPRPAQ